MKDLKNNMEKLLNDILESPSALDKRQISIFLSPTMLDKLDTLTEAIKEKSKEKITRNYLIELAIKNLIECAPSVLKSYEEKYIKSKEEFDTVVFPCDITGVDTFKRTKSWFFVRTDKSKIDRLKYIALYTTTPIQEVTHYGEIEKYEAKNFNGQIKYIYYLKNEPIELERHIPLGNSNPQSTRSPKYTTFEKLKTAKEYSDLTL